MPAATPQGPQTSRTTASSVPRQDWSEHRSRDLTLSVETVTWDQQGATVVVGGELDIGTAPPLWAVLRHHLGAGRRFLRLDVTTLTFVDAGALSGLRAIHDEALATRGTLIVTGVGGTVARVLHLTGFDQVLFLGGSRSGGVPPDSEL